MALYQSEMAKAEALRNSAAPVVSQKLSFMHAKESRLNSFVTLENPGDASYEGGTNSLEESNKGYRSGQNNQTISHLINNLDLIKNVNKQNRLSSNERKRSYSG
jgi:hypothetical protein